MASTLLRPIGHEDRLSLVDHLDELRSRLIVCVLTLLVAFGFAFWQQDTIIEVLNGPLEGSRHLAADGRSADPLEQQARFTRELGQALEQIAPALGSVRASLGELAESEALSAPERRSLEASLARLSAAQAQTAQAARAAPTNFERQPVTLGVTEPFTVTLSVAFYAALLLSLPVLLYQAYAFVLPAFSPSERRVALPLMLMVPFLFIAGVAFGYFVVLDRAIEFLQNFNDDSFDILVQARDYYKFSIIFVAAIGLLFQIPIGVLAITQTGIVTPRQLRKNRGYVILGMAVLAAVATPTPDPVTMLLAMGPLVLLFELSILLSSWLSRIRPPDRETEPDPDPDDDALDKEHA